MSWCVCHGYDYGFACGWMGDATIMISNLE